jgi:hypothetical protein
VGVAEGDADGADDAGGMVLSAPAVFEESFETHEAADKAKIMHRVSWTVATELRSVARIRRGVFIINFTSASN